MAELLRDFWLAGAYLKCEAMALTYQDSALPIVWLVSEASYSNELPSEADYIVLIYKWGS